MLTRIVNQDGEGVEQCARLLRAGRVAAIPTETVYGLAGSAENSAAVREIFRAKGRPQDNPLIAHIADISALHDICAAVPDAACELARRFWPGPLTMVLRSRGVLAPELSGGLDTVAVRMPAHPAALAVIRACGFALAAPSANLSGLPSPTRAAHVARDLCGKIPLIMDGGPCGVGLESTVISLVGAPTLLRPGGLAREAIERVTGPLAPPSLSDESAPPSPGMKYRHYAPRTPLVLVRGPGAPEYIRRHADGAAALCFDGEEGALGCPCVAYGREDKPETLMRGLFDALRRLDQAGARVIYARCPGDGPGCEALLNRMQRAAAKTVDAP